MTYPVAIIKTVERKMTQRSTTQAVSAQAKARSKLNFLRDTFQSRKTLLSLRNNPKNEYSICWALKNTFTASLENRQRNSGVRWRTVFGAHYWDWLVGVLLAAELHIHFHTPPLGFASYDTKAGNAGM
jgi:hypothetical protein